MEREIKEFLQRQMEEESEQILETVNSDPELADLEVPEELHDELFAQIRQYEEEKAKDRLSDEERELIHLGTVYKKKRKRTKYYVLAAALIAAMAFGLTSIGGPEKVVEIFKRTIAGREQIRVNTDDEKIDSVEVDSEEEAYQEIEDKFGFKPVRLSYVPEDTNFEDIKIDETTQSIFLTYSENNQSRLMYQMTTNYKKGSQGIDVEDQLVEEYQLQVNQVSVVMRDYWVEEEEIHRFNASFEYGGVQYLLTGNKIEKVEFEKILKSLYFF